MALNNPFQGGPDFVRALVNAIEAAPTAYAHPPQASGPATSVRMPKERVMYLDAIATATNGKWTRNDVINALLDKGLFALFHELKDEDVERITEQAAQQLFPPAHGVSKMEPYNGHRIEALASQTPDGRWHSIYRYALADNPAMIFTSESTEQNFATEEEAIEHGRRRAMERIDKL